MNARTWILRRFGRELPELTLRWDRATDPELYDAIVPELRRMLAQSLLHSIRADPAGSYVIATLTMDGVRLAKLVGDGGHAPPSDEVREDWRGPAA